MPQTPSHATLEDVRQTLSDVQGMIEEYQRMTGLRFGTTLVVTAGAVTSFVSTLQPETLVPLLRSLADKIERDELGSDANRHPKPPLAH